MRFLYLLLVLTGSLCAHAQTISGKVLTSQQQPLDGAHIHIGSRHGISLSDGSYHVHGLSMGTNRVIVSYVGYKALDTLINVQGDIHLDAILRPETTQLDEVVLAGNSSISKNTVHEQRLSTQILEKYSDATLGDALKEVAGVFSLKTGSTIVKPVINGLHSSRVPVIANNVRLEDQQWGTEHAPNLDINAAGRVSVIKGANALQYGGDAVGGLVLVEPVKVLKDTLYGKTLLTASSNGRGSSLATSLHKGADQGWAWNAGGTFKYFGDREAPDYVLSNTGNREANFNGDLTLRHENYSLGGSYTFYNATIGIAKATHIGNVADLVRAINSGEPNTIESFGYEIGAPRQEVQHHLAKANYSQSLSGNTSLDVQYAFQLNRRKEYDMRRGDLANTPALDLALVTHSVQADWKKEADNMTLKGGISAAAQKNTASADTGVRPLIPDYNKYDAGAYGIAAYRFTDSFSGEAGLRYDFSRMDAQKFYQKTRWTDLGYDGVYDHFITADYGTQWLANPVFNFHNISASLGIRQKLDEDWELLANAGLAMRNPNPSELFSDGLHHSNGTIELGSLAIKKEEAYKLSATLLKSGDSFSFEATPYFNFIEGFIYLQPTGIEYTTRGAFPIYRYKQTNAFLSGADIQGTWNISNNWRYSGSIAWLYGADISNREPLIDMPPLNFTNTIRYACTDWHKLFIEFRGETVFRQKRYPDNNFIVDVPQNNGPVPITVDISTPPAGYHLFHFSSGMSFKIIGNSTASVSFSVQNIFNTAYRDYLNRQRLYIYDTGRNFQLQLKINY